MEGDILMGIVWAVYLFFLLPLYKMKEKQKGAIKAVFYKLTLSGVFCCIGLLGIFRQDTSPCSVLIFLALVFSLFGDYYLVYIKDNEEKFVKGIMCFGIAHILYITAMTVQNGFSFLEILILVIIIISFLMIKLITKLDLGKTNLPLSCYTIIVTFMAVKAVLMLFQGKAPLAEQIMFSTGALLFWISDAFLGTWKFIDSKKLFSYIVSICYFLGQLMIATSVFYQR